MSAISRPAVLRRLPTVGLPTGIGAIIVKELRGRMRGRRAFVVVTIHVLLLAGFAWMLQRVNQASVELQTTYASEAAFASATIGRGIFIGLLQLQTLVVAVLAPAATAGAISSEREHQTLDLLAATPISSLAIVVGKLFSALAWVFVLILASIPVTAMVFLFGGVGPEDVIRGYVVLVAAAIGLGSIGIFFSAVTRRTGASTALTFVVTLALVVGSQYLWTFLARTGDTDSFGLRTRPPEAILYLNPFVAQSDIACGTGVGYGSSCEVFGGLIDDDPLPLPGVEPGLPRDLPGGFGGGSDGVMVDGVIVIGGKPDVAEPDEARPGAVVSTVVLPRDRFWPKSVASFLLLAVVLTLASVQFVSPTRRWRPRLPGSARPAAGGTPDA